MRKVVGSLSIVSIVAAGVAPNVASAYSEDTVDTGGFCHSSFHYQLTRTLARAAGFSQNDASAIAIASQQADSQQTESEFVEYVCPSEPLDQYLVLEGTERRGANSALFHWPRRGPMNATSVYAQPGGVDTCGFFAGLDDACVGGNPETNEIENWAFGRSALVSGTTPTMSVNLAPPVAVPSGSLVSLGIYAHALADSYSHQVCMETEKTRSHEGYFLSTGACEPLLWHLSAEFGSGDGVSYTNQAAYAVFLAFKQYRTDKGLPGAPLMTDKDVTSFISKWAKQKTALMRNKLADDQLAKL